MACKTCKENGAFYGEDLHGERKDSSGHYFVAGNLFIVMCPNDSVVDKLVFSFCPMCGERLSKLK